MASLQLKGMDSERGVIKRIENGTRFVTDLELCLLADFFGVSVETLLFGSEDIPDTDCKQE